MLRFFKGVPRVYVWDHERKGNILVEFNLDIKETDGFGFSQTESLKDFHNMEGDDLTEAIQQGGMEILRRVVQSR